MSTLYNENEYLYSSARVRAMENSMIGNDAISRMLEAENRQQVMTILADKGVAVVKHTVDTDDSDLPMDSFNEELTDYEATLNNIVKKAFDEIEEMSEDKSPVNIVRYTYDCNNIKAAVKGYIRALSELDCAAMMIDLGTVSISNMLNMIHDKTYNLLPVNMALAVPVALNAYHSTKDPKQIDLILDRACFDDMLTTAQGFRCSYITDYVKTRIDLTNFMMTLRIICMKRNTTAPSLAANALIRGGSIAPTEFAKIFTELDKYSSIKDLMKKSNYEALTNAMHDEQISLSAIEKAIDDYCINMLKQTKKVSFGAEVLFAYLLATEFAVKNVRIILAGKAAELDRKVISERMRECYV